MLSVVRSCRKIGKTFPENHLCHRGTVLQTQFWERVHTRTSGYMPGHSKRVCASWSSPPEQYLDLWQQWLWSQLSLGWKTRKQPCYVPQEVKLFVDKLKANALSREETKLAVLGIWWLRDFCICQRLQWTFLPYQFPVPSSSHSRILSNAKRSNISPENLGLCVLLIKT